MSNVLFINGWGNALTSRSIANLRTRTINRFGDQIYAPPPVDYTDTSMLLRYLDKWKDIQLIAALSCGCTTIEAIADARQGEIIPYAIFYSPSIWCGFGRTPVPKNVLKATQATSTPYDIFNPGGRLILKRRAGNTVTKIDEIKTNYSHGWTCDHPGAQMRFWAEIEATLKGGPNPLRV